MTLIEELRWRGLLQDIMPETEEYLENNKVKGYAGFDPTADSLHIGNLVPIMLLCHLQRRGHMPVALVGGATGMIGDPSGKSAERQFLSEDVLRHNENAIQRQLMRFLDFETKENPAEMVNNYDWFKEINFLTFLREAGKYITVNYMMSKDSVKSRISGDSGISYTEFTYQLIQGYDFYWLYKNKNVQLQVAGADQWGNITTGTTLIRKKQEEGLPVFAFTAPLIVREDGTKFGKTADGQNIWLDAKRTSPFRFFQYWLNVSDDDAERYIKIFTFLPVSEIEEAISAHKEAPHLRNLQKTLAKEVTIIVHGEAGLAKAEHLTAFLFGGNITPEMLQSLSAEMWEDVLENMYVSDRKKMAFEGRESVGILDLLAESGVTASKGDAKRAVTGGAVSLNGNKVTDPMLSVSFKDSFNGKYLFVQSGKKNKYIIECTQ
ncbi:MAG: tyrosine--tRNA ligase [Bacteroidia bacterium]|nr:tyrosine--tRNA ligase [Bacteroidia bacterium]